MHSTDNNTQVQPQHNVYSKSLHRPPRPPVGRNSLPKEAKIKLPLINIMQKPGLIESRKSHLKEPRTGTNAEHAKVQLETIPGVPIVISIFD